MGQNPKILSWVAPLVFFSKLYADFSVTVKDETKNLRYKIQIGLGTLVVTTINVIIFYGVRQSIPNESFMSYCHIPIVGFICHIAPLCTPRVIAETWEDIYPLSDRIPDKWYQKSRWVMLGVLIVSQLLTNVCSMWLTTMYFHTSPMHQTMYRSARFCVYSAIQVRCIRLSFLLIFVSRVLRSINDDLKSVQDQSADVESTKKKFSELMDLQKKTRVLARNITRAFGVSVPFVALLVALDLATLFGRGAFSSSCLNDDEYFDLAAWGLICGAMWLVFYSCWMVTKEENRREIIIGDLIDVVEDESFKNRVQSCLVQLNHRKIDFRLGGVLPMDFTMACVSAAGGITLLAASLGCLNTL